MSEAHRDESMNSPEKEARIIRFPSEPTAETTTGVDPESLAPVSLVESFLAIYRDGTSLPKDPAVIADGIRELLDADLRDASVRAIPDERLPWRQAYLKLSVDGMDLSVDQWDACEASDPVFRTITGLRRDTRGIADLTAQRRALEGLQNFRLGVQTRGIATDDEDWHRVLDALFVPTSR